MKFAVKLIDLGKKVQESVVLAISEKGELTASGKILDKRSLGFLSQLVKKGDFTAKTGQSFLLTQVPHCHTKHILLVGTGKTLSVNEKDFRKVTALSVKALQSTQATHLLSFLTELEVGKRSIAWKVKHSVEASGAALYSYDKFKSEKKPASKLSLITIAIDNKKNVKACETALEQGEKIAEGVSYTKNLGNLPSNICTPTYLADAAKQLAKAQRKVTVKILEEKDMKKLGMGAFLSVTKGSAEPAKLICLEYKGTAKKSRPIALIGKGITFDTGGLSLKPADSMVGMKYDMCGAATVLGTIKTIAELNLPIHVVGIIAAAENMPSGTASKPEDIVTTMSGQTVEIMNTDAEGRLVLCDALTYCGEKYKPEAMIDIATLTGAVVIALGHHATGMLSNNQDLADSLLAAGTESHDRAWQMPLWEEYQEQLNSPFADMSNVGGRSAGTITAACFLSRYTKKFAWAHLDVAGTAAMMGGNDRYATGRPVPLLVQYLINKSEK